MAMKQCTLEEQKILIMKHIAWIPFKLNLTLNEYFVCQ